MHDRRRKPESDYLPGPMWTDTAAQQAWVSTWTTVVKHFSNESAVIGYHLLGLPDPPNVATYQGFLAAVATAIRTAGVGLPLLVSAPADGLPSDLAEFEPLNDDSTVYLITTFAPYRYLLQSLDAEGKLTYGGPFELQRDGESGQFDQTWSRLPARSGIQLGRHAQRPAGHWRFRHATMATGIAGLSPRSTGHLQPEATDHHALAVATRRGCR
ncbi:MAG: hypothetical protein R2839_03915 [Thermomicrobiales bacterium]